MRMVSQDIYGKKWVAVRNDSCTKAYVLVSILTFGMAGTALEIGFLDLLYVLQNS